MSEEISGSCHCGKVQFTINQQPHWLTDCNCSICRRLGCLWGHVAIASVTMAAPEDSTLRYIHGDRMLAFHTCRNCGCTTHWENLSPDKDSHMAVNFRMCEPSEVEKHQIRHFDGAESWAYLD